MYHINECLDAQKHGVMALTLEDWVIIVLVICVIILKFIEFIIESSECQLKKVFT